MLYFDNRYSSRSLSTVPLNRNGLSRRVASFSFEVLYFFVKIDLESFCKFNDSC